MGNNETGSGTSAYPNEPRFGNSDYPCNTPPAQTTPGVIAGVDQVVVRRIPDRMTKDAVRASIGGAPCCMDAQRLAAIGVPQLQRAVLPGGGEALPIGRPGAGPDTPLMAVELGEVNRPRFPGGHMI